MRRRLLIDGLMMLWPEAQRNLIIFVYHLKTVVQCLLIQDLCEFLKTVISDETTPYVVFQLSDYLKLICT